jgi:hypothetical protein
MEVTGWASEEKATDSAKHGIANHSVLPWHRSPFNAPIEAVPHDQRGTRPQFP